VSKQQFLIRKANRGLGEGCILGTYQEQLNFNTSGDLTIIPASVTRISKIHKLFLVGSGASNIRLWSGPSSENDPISGQMNFVSSWALALDSDDFTLMGEAGKAIILNSSTAIQIGGIIVYSIT